MVLCSLSCHLSVVRVFKVVAIVAIVSSTATGLVDVALFVRSFVFVLLNLGVYGALALASLRLRGGFWDTWLDGYVACGIGSGFLTSFFSIYFLFRWEGWMDGYGPLCYVCETDGIARES